MTLPLVGLDHLVLRVIDLDAMLRFYLDALGCVIERRQDEIGLVQLRAGRSLSDPEGNVVELKGPPSQSPKTTFFLAATHPSTLPP